MSNIAPEKIVIVGGVAGGASAAARLRRLNEEAEIILIERGPDVSFANCGMPYYLGGEITHRERLALQTPGSLESQLNLKVMTLTEAVAIDPAMHTLSWKRVGGETGEGTLYWDRLILAPGAAPLRPPVEGIDDARVMSLRNLVDMDRIKDSSRDANRIVIVGAGFIGLEVAEQFAHQGKTVTVVELQDQILPVMDAEMVRPLEAELRLHGVKLELGDGLKRFYAEGSTFGVELASGKRLDADLAILAIGVRPESTLAREAGLELGPRGHIRVNDFMQTSSPEIYAVGDAIESRDPLAGGFSAVPLGGPANRQGRLAADHISESFGWSGAPRVSAYPGSIGTAIVRVFDMVAGTTGLTEKRLSQLGREFRSVVVNGMNHASYYPGASNITLKLLWEPSSGKVLGAQAYGSQDVDKRLDVMATAIRAGMTVSDLEQLELSYAPPFGSAKDVVNIAGFAACNIGNGMFHPVPGLPSEQELANPDSPLFNAQIIDVRPAENSALRPVPLPGVINIPFGQLRSRLSGLDRARPVLTVCQMGKMSYFAARVLANNGFKAFSLTGGVHARVVDPGHPAVPSPSVAVPAPTPAPTCCSAPEASPSCCSAPSGNSVPVIQAEPVKLDCTGLACPGPILKVREASEKLLPGQQLKVEASDPGFLRDIAAFARANSLELIDSTKSGGIVRATLAKPAPSASSPAQAMLPSISGEPARRSGATLVVFSGDFDKVMAALIIANGAVAMGGSATLFFTFWGLNALRKEEAPAEAAQGKDFMDKMFGAMLPKGVANMPLSQMNMMGMGAKMMKSRMAERNLPNPKGLLEEAIRNGVRLVACTMSMTAMGISREELIDEVELGGVADFLDASSTTGTSLFI